MREHKYIARDEAVTLMLLDALTTKVAEEAANTTNPDWQEKFQTIAKWLDEIIFARVELLDEKQRTMLARKSLNSSCKIVTKDEARTKAWMFANQQKNVTIETNDLFDLGDYALLECMTCPQGCKVKECKMRELYHRVGFEPTRTDVKDGECEFRFDNEQKSVGVDYKKFCRAIV